MTASAPRTQRISPIMQAFNLPMISTLCRKTHMDKAKKSQNSQNSQSNNKNCTMLNINSGSNKCSLERTLMLRKWKIKITSQRSWTTKSLINRKMRKKMEMTRNTLQCHVISLLSNPKSDTTFNSNNPCNLCTSSKKKSLKNFQEGERLEVASQSTSTVIWKLHWNRLLNGKWNLRKYQRASLPSIRNSETSCATKSLHSNHVSTGKTKFTTRKQQSYLCVERSISSQILSKKSWSPTMIKLIERTSKNTRVIKNWDKNQRASKAIKTTRSRTRMRNKIKK